MLVVVVGVLLHALVKSYITPKDKGKENNGKKK